jgi:small subunit ribosomal protein S18
VPRINNPKPPKRAPKDVGRRGVKKKPCAFCQHGVKYVDYKDLNQLRKYVSDRGKIRGRRVSGNCQQHQRDVADAIKTARELALLPYTQRTVTERRGGRGRDRDRDRDRDRGPRSEPRAEVADVAVVPSEVEIDVAATEGDADDVSAEEILGIEEVEA